MYAAGRILNPRTALSRFLGGAIMGMGMALHEEGVLDPAMAEWATTTWPNITSPCTPTSRQMEAALLDEQDEQINPMGSKGIGAIGIVCPPAAIVNAVWHATGVRIRDLAVRLDKLLAHLWLSGCCHPARLLRRMPDPEGPQVGDGGR